MKKKKKLELIAKKLRQLILEVGVKNNGHISTSLSCVEILVSLYFGGHLNFDKIKFKKRNRNTFVLSKGHAETALYCCLYLKKFISKKNLYYSYNCGSYYLGNHVDHNVPGIELTTGSLGHGLSFSAGMSLSSKIDGFKHKHFVLLGDAECSEGSVWEAALFGSFHKLNNLVAIVDNNKIGSLDYTNNFTSVLDNFKDKWKSFGWSVQIVNGHSFSEILLSLKKVNQSKKPNLIIANTIKGKGLSIMENDPIWHVKKLDNLSEIKLCKKELDI
jgi:transketolase